MREDPRYPDVLYRAMGGTRCPACDEGLPAIEWPECPACDLPWPESTMVFIPEHEQDELPPPPARKLIAEYYIGGVYYTVYNRAV